MALNIVRHAISAVMLAAALAGCSYFDGDDEEAVIEAEAQLPQKIPVEFIETLELGRLYDGYMLTAYAVAPGVGYYQPELRPRYDGAPAADGFYEFDFLVRPPQEVAAQADPPAAARRVRGDFELPVEMLRGAAGVRVWSARDSVEGRF